MFNGTLRESLQFTHNDFFKLAAQVKWASKIKYRQDDEWIFNNCVHQEVWNFHQDYLKNVGFPYLSNMCVKFGKESVEKFTEQEMDNLKTQFFYCNSQDAAIKEEQYKQKMLDDGFLPLTKEIAEEAIIKNKKLHLVGTGTNSLGWNTKRDTVLKVTKQHDGSYFFFPPRCSRRGFNFESVADQFVKFI